MVHIVRICIVVLAMSALPIGAAAQTITGRVVDASTGIGVNEALVQLLTSDSVVLRATLTNLDGDFALQEDASEDTVVLRIAQVGFVDARVQLAVDRAGHRLTIELEPLPLPLKPIDVTATSENRWLRSAGFYDRQKLGFGSFITRQDIEGQFSTARSTGDILRSLPRLKIERDSNEEYVYVRSSTDMRGRPCLAQIYLNGQFVGRSVPAMHPDNIEAIEVYPGVAQIPAQYSGSDGACGVVLIWLRTGVG